MAQILKLRAGPPLSSPSSQDGPTHLLQWHMKQKIPVVLWSLLINSGLIHRLDLSLQQQQSPYIAKNITAFHTTRWP